MPLPPPIATSLKRWSKKLDSTVLAMRGWGIILALLLATLVGACVDEAVEPESDGAAAQEETSEPEQAEDIEVLDDERSVERRIQDASIAAQVKLALVDAKELRPFDVEPTVANGRVLLRGEVRTQEQRSRAATLAEEVGGVRNVVNEITATEEPEVAESESSRDSAAAAIAEAAQPDSSPQPKKESPSSSSSSDAVYHTVRSGESLWHIARNNDTTIDAIKRLNNLGSTNLQPGQRLRVK